MTKIERRGIAPMSENKKIRLRLSTPADIRKTLAKITNMIANNEIDTKKANTIIYSCNAILNSIRADELEKKIHELEEYINDNQ
jgi:hypothetical protein